mmetsp:Transcript_10562/g.23228  ORF Transcript_10562/g.23228 Transcript_10562/m.23228 type:complete len:342 (+) Transcript_10562:1134-2159(+)
MLHAQRATSHGISFFISILLTTHTKRQTINDPHRRSKLPSLQTLRRQVLLVIGTNLVNIPTKLGSLVILGSITLSLETTLGSQLHILDLIVDILLPLTQPLNRRIMTDLSPRMARHTAHWHRCILRYINHDLLRFHALLQFAHLGVFPPSSERTRRFHIVIPHLLQMTIHQSITELEQRFILTILIHLPLLIGNRLTNQLLLIEVSLDGTKVTLFKVFDDMVFTEDGTKVGEEVFDEDGGGFGVAEVHSVGVHCGEEAGSLLFRRPQLNLRPIIQHLDPMRHISLRKRHPRMLHLDPLASIGRIISIPPLIGLHAVGDAFYFVELFELFGFAFFLRFGGGG